MCVGADCQICKYDYIAFVLNGRFDLWFSTRERYIRRRNTRTHITSDVSPIWCGSLSNWLICVPPTILRVLAYCCHKYGRTTIVLNFNKKQNWIEIVCRRNVVHANMYYAWIICISDVNFYRVESSCNYYTWCMMEIEFIYYLSIYGCDLVIRIHGYYLFTAKYIILNLIVGIYPQTYIHIT